MKNAQVYLYDKVVYTNQPPLEQISNAVMWDRWLTISGLQITLKIEAAMMVLGGTLFIANIEPGAVMVAVIALM